MEQKLYQQMTVEEQLRYVTDLTTFVNEKLPVLERIGDAWEISHRKDMETGLQLIGAFMFARDFVDKALRYGDYAARVHRIRVYIDKIKGEIAKGLSLKGSDGHTYALVSPTVPQRRRGRPSAAEVEARRNGIEIPRPTDPEMEKQMVIARLMGVEIIVSDKVPREKNNAEVAAEKAVRQAEYDRQNPSLFPADTSESSGKNNVSAANSQESGSAGTSKAMGQVSVPSDSPAPQSGLPCPTMSEVYQDRIDQDRLRLNDLAWLCSDDLKKRIEMVRGLRVTAESASERAKTMADMGASPDQIAPYAQQAKEAVEGYLAIYAAVDEELAVQFKRLSIDVPYQEKFKGRFRGVDIEKVLHITRPYYEKVRKDDPTVDVRIKQAIEQDNPEYAARLKAEEEKKQEMQALHRYIVRKDKEASDERVKTMTERIERMRELAGDEVANSYLPILAKTKEDNIAWRDARDKAAIKREESDAGIESSKREQTRRESVKSDSPAPKEPKKSSAKKAQPKQARRASVKK